jgi:chaperonin GroES
MAVMTDKGKLHPTKVLVIDHREEEQKTASGIIIPGLSNVPSMKGKVALVGEGTTDIRMVYAKGDTVYYNPNAGLKLTLDGVDYRLVDQVEIFFGHEEV